MSNKYNSSPFSGLAVVIIVLVVIGTIVGLALGGTDLFNFITNPAKVGILKSQGDLDLQKATFDLQQYMQRQTAQTAEEIEQAKVAAVAAAQSALIWNEILRLGGFTAVGVLAVAALTVVFLMAAAIKSKILQPKAAVEMKAYDPWQDPVLRAREIEFAKRRERLSRTTNVAETSRTPKPDSRRPEEDGGFITIFKN